MLAIERRAATAAGLTVTGLPGVVAGAKKAGLIDLTKPVLDDLIQIARAGYVLDSGGYGLAAFRGADALVPLPGSGTKASRAGQGAGPTERLSEQLAELSADPD